MQRLRRLSGKIHQRIGEHAEPEHSRDTDADGNFDRRGQFNRRHFRFNLAPVNRAHHAEIIVERNHHARERRERKAIIAAISGG